MSKESTQNERDQWTPPPSESPKEKRRTAVRTLPAGQASKETIPHVKVKGDPKTVLHNNSEEATVELPKVKERIPASSAEEHGREQSAAKQRTNIPSKKETPTAPRDLTRLLHHSAEADTQKKKRNKRFATLRRMATYPKKISRKRTKRMMDKGNPISRFFFGSGTVTVGEGRIFSVPLHTRRHVLLHNPVTHALRRIYAFFRSAELRFYGVLLLTFGVTTVLAYYLSYLIPAIPARTIYFLLPGIVTMLAALPLLFSGTSLSAALERSGLLRTLFFDLFGANRCADLPATGGMPWAVLLGAFFGCLGIFVSPLVLLGILLVAFLCIFAFASPEFALILTAFSIPFLTLFRHPTVILTAALTICFLSFFVKWLMGKRDLHFAPIDLFVLLFLLFYLCGGIFSYAKQPTAGGAAIASAMMISVYFLSSNLMIDLKRIRTLFRALTLSSFLIALLGIYQHFSGDVIADFLDTQAYRYITGRIGSTFGNPNVLAGYLVLVIPCSFSLLLEKKDAYLHRLFQALIFFSLLLALIFTWSRGAWLGMALSLLTFFILSFRKSPRVLVALFAFLPNLLLFLPESVLQRLLSALSVLGMGKDSSISYRFTIWKDSLSLFFDNFFGGIGVGRDAFTTAFLPYASGGAEVAEHAHNLLLQIGIEVGIFGLLLFCLILLCQCRNTYSVEFTVGESEVRPYVIAAFASVIALLTNGLSDYVWQNSRVAFLFWLLLGLCTACYRTAIKEQRQKDACMGRKSDIASIDVQIRGS